MSHLNTNSHKNQTVTALREKRQSFFESIDKYIGSSFTATKKPQLLLKVFKDFDPSSYGTSAINIIKDINANNQLPITNSDLNDFCNH